MAAYRAIYGAVAMVALSTFLAGCGGGAGKATSFHTSPSTSTAAPAQRTATPSTGTPVKAGTKCTDQINYAGDPRSNAEINSIGEQTGHCPPIQH